MNEWLCMMKEKELREEAVLVLKSCFVFIWNDRRKPLKYLVRMVGGPVDIWTWYLPKYKSDEGLSGLIGWIHRVTYSYAHQVLQYIL
jgi:hypothetical protein